MRHGSAVVLLAALAMVLSAAAAEPPPPPPPLLPIVLTAPEVVPPNATFDVRLAYALAAPARASLWLQAPGGAARPAAPPLELPAGRGSRTVRVTLPRNLNFTGAPHEVKISVTTGDGTSSAPAAAAHAVVAVLHGPAVRGLYFDYPLSIGGYHSVNSNHGYTSYYSSMHEVTLHDAKRCAAMMPYVNQSHPVLAATSAYNGYNYASILDAKSGCISTACYYGGGVCATLSPPPTPDDVLAAARGLNCSAFVAALDAAADAAHYYALSLPNVYSVSQSSPLDDAVRYLDRMRAAMNARKGVFVAAASAARAGRPGLPPGPDWSSSEALALGTEAKLPEGALRLRPPGVPC